MKTAIIYRPVLLMGIAVRPVKYIKELCMVRDARVKNWTMILRKALKEANKKTSASLVADMAVQVSCKKFLRMQLP